MYEKMFAKRMDHLSCDFINSRKERERKMKIKKRLIQCPRCRGFGANQGDGESGIKCICNGHGKVTKNENGTYTPKHGRKEVNY